jgi:hypothetical protein
MKMFFLDFEASSLAEGSFPIEVAWVDQVGQGERYLIRPAPDCTDWSGEAEMLHGIGRQDLVRHGTPYEQVARRAVKVLAAEDVRVFSDSPPFDGRWLQHLLAAAGVTTPVQLLHIVRLYSHACEPLRQALSSPDAPAYRNAEERVRNLVREIVARAEEAAALRPRVQHRALPDAESLWRTWRLVQQGVVKAVEAGKAGG